MSDRSENETISLRISPDLRKRIEQHAQSSGQGRSDSICDAVVEFLDQESGMQRITRKDMANCFRAMAEALESDDR